MSLRNTQYRYLKIYCSFLLVMGSVGYCIGQTNNARQSESHETALETYAVIRQQLLTQTPPVFPVRNNDYTVAGFKEVRLQIWKSNLQPVRTYLLQAFSSNEVIGDASKWVAARSVWVEYLVSIDSFDLAHREALLLTAYADSAKPHNAALAWLSLANTAWRVDDYANANANVEKVLAQARTTSDKYLEARAELTAGFIARKYFWGYSGRAIPYYNKAIAAATLVADTPTIIRACIVKAADMAEAGDILKGQFSFKQALQLSIAGGYLKLIPNLCEHSYVQLAATNQANEAADMLLAALRYVQRFGMLINETHFYQQLAEFYTNRRLYDSALYYYDQCKNQGHLEPGVRSPALQKADVYYLMGNYKQAAELYNKGIPNYLSSFVLQGQGAISRWEATLRMQDKEIEIQQNAAKRRQLIWGISGIAAILVIALLALLWQRSLRRRLAAQNRLISRQSLKLQQSLAEKEMLLKEIHHRVKNNLQVIDSLLDMHQGGIGGPQQQEEAFTKARTHVHTIAMIHQNLYQQQDVSAVDMHAFANDLFAQTERLFNKYQKVAVFTNHIHSIHLDIDTAVPLGLILNELLTNAFKYVLPVAEKMELTVSITPGTGPEKYILQCQDNGPGLPDGVLPVQPKSLGLQLVKQLSRQVGGRLSYEYQEGSCFTIPFLTMKGRKEMD